MIHTALDLRPRIKA